ncbi:hypothetical protein SASPL_106421 [Salvia splendens]|uniref:alpha-amylase n=1 Tax=Salvia splendens TaxID=180675 RepID=A0A8X8YMU7_SALSN|nr:hypothetical protein SASPL_106421 [Salvia splendens]
MRSRSSTTTTNVVAFPGAEGDAGLCLYPYLPCCMIISLVRKRNGIDAGSKVEILKAEADLYVAKIDGKIITKIGGKMDLGNLIPTNFKVATSEDGYAVFGRSKVDFAFEKKN